MSSATTAPTYKAALMAALQARANIIVSGASVAWSHPGDDALDTDHGTLFFGKTRATNSIPVMSGSRMKRNEEYVVELYIDIAVAGSDQSASEIEAYALFDEVDDQIATDTTVGVRTSSGFVIKSLIQDWELTPYVDPNTKGWGALMKLDIAVTARLS